MSLLQKALVYLGLVDENEADSGAEPASTQARPARRGQTAVDASSAAEGRRVEPLGDTVRTVTADEYTSPIRQVDAGNPQCDVIPVEDFADARILADRIRDRIPVVLDLRSSDPDLVRRVVDFSSGLIYALDGTMNKTVDGVILVQPPRFHISTDEKRRLARLGLYAMSDEG